jgi:hypothetical protein
MNTTVPVVELPGEPDHWVTFSRRQSDRDYNRAPACKMLAVGRRTATVRQRAAIGSGGAQ